MTDPFVREIPLAYRLGYTEMEDFRRALKRGDIPAPKMYIGKGRKRHPLWDPGEVDEWLRIDSKQTQDEAVEAAIAEI